jgi:hypothetical protein
MIILDFTDILNNGAMNYYTFNPCLLHIGQNKYLVVYRIASYDLPMTYHCWKVWNSSYRLFKNPKAASSTKYREYLGLEITHNINSSPIIQRFPEFDSTGLALVEFVNYKFKLIWNIAELFPNEMNQDARIQYMDGKYSIIYNVFDAQGVKLRVRDLEIFESKLTLTRERYLFPHIYRDVEKHACYEHHRGKIQYAIGEDFLEFIENGIKYKRKVYSNRFQDLLNRYGKENVLFSLSTPSIEYKENYLACGHAKFLYKKIQPDFDFLRNLDISKIIQHGKYIYFIYFYEFSKTGDILRISTMFLPTIANCHLPYLLAMPMGLTKMPHNKFMVGYGEGDCRTKCLILNENEMEYILNDNSTTPCFLTEQLQIQHVGYFGHKNCGDDAFELIFRHLYKHTPHKYSFSDSHFNSKSSINILGGGDVMNDYFAKNVSENSIALSVGIPYSDFNKLLHKFKCVYLRNSNDYEVLKKQFTNCHFSPDLTFLLPTVFSNEKDVQTNTIGIILTRTYFNTKYLDLYFEFCKQIATFVDLAIEQNNCKFCFIPFCINKNNVQENDFLIIEDVLKFVKNTKSTEIFVANENNFVKETYFKIASMDFNICSRFHSHVFSMIHNVSFISLTCGRKCIEFMKDLPECLYRLKTNSIDLPIEFDGALFFHFFKQQIAMKQKTKDKLKKLSEIYIKQVQEFELHYEALISKYANSKRIVLWSPGTVPDSLSSSPNWKTDEKVKESRQRLLCDDNASETKVLESKPIIDSKTLASSQKTIIPPLTTTVSSQQPLYLQNHFLPSVPNTQISPQPYVPQYYLPLVQVPYIQVIPQYYLPLVQVPYLQVIPQYYSPVVFNVQYQTTQTLTPESNVQK